MASAPTEMIQVGALSVRFLVEAADSHGSASVFECFVPADSKMPAPHSHDAFEETIYGLDVLAPSAGGPPDLARVADVMRRHGLTPAPPAS
jgi:hypothetical protein